MTSQIPLYADIAEDMMNALQIKDKKADKVRKITRLNAERTTRSLCGWIKNCVDAKSIDKQDNNLDVIVLFHASLMLCAVNIQRGKLCGNTRIGY